MGTTVLDPGPSPAPSLHLYAHCLRNHPGGVALVVINADANQKQSLAVNTSFERYTLTAQTLTDKQVQLNGVDLKLGSDDALPDLTSVETKPGEITFAPASITFLALPGAYNASCEQ